MLALEKEGAHDAPLDESTWLTAKAVVRGRSHRTNNKPCQDACAFYTGVRGKWMVAVVSDGAGSASRADEGARLVAEGVAAGVIAASFKLEARGPGVWLKDHVHRTVLDVRDQLRDKGANIDEFKCTLVGVLVGPAGGIFFHVGDGAALASRVATRGDEQSLTDREAMLWGDLVLSGPENGEYANETYFITQNDWEKHLRIDVLSDTPDIIALMTDGALPLVVQRQRPNAPFMDPVVRQLLRAHDGAARGALLEEYLSNPEVDSITDDDKTLFIAIHRRLLTIPPDKLVSGVSTRELSPQVEEPRSIGSTARLRLASASHSAPSVSGMRRTASLTLVLAGAATVLAMVSTALSASVLCQHAPGGRVAEASEFAAIAAPPAPSGRSTESMPEPSDTLTSISPQPAASIAPAASPVAVDATPPTSIVRPMVPRAAAKAASPIATTSAKPAVDAPVPAPPPSASGAPPPPMTAETASAPNRPTAGPWPPSIAGSAPSTPIATAH
jgi:hypothetical protein